MIVIAGSWPLLIQALQSSGLSFARMARSPVRINGMWRCEVRS